MALGSLLAMIAGCSPGGLYRPTRPISQLLVEMPETVVGISDEGFCDLLRASEDSPDWTEKDKALALKELRRRGFSKRDAELIAERGQYYGTGMTFRGLECSISPGAQVVNRAFYPYAGHQWQVDVGNFEFVYLRGDGTESGMRVYAWN